MLFIFITCSAILLKDFRRSQIKSMDHIMMKAMEKIVRCQFLPIIHFYMVYIFTF